MKRITLLFLLVTLSLGMGAKRCRVRPELISGGSGCKLDGRTKIDGWFLKLMPFHKRGRTPESVSKDYSPSSQILQIPFLYKCVSPGDTQESNLELWAGFMGYRDDPETRVLSPQIGWLVRKGQ